MTKNDSSLRITTLGAFSVIKSGKVLSQSVSRSSQVWRLFKYLLTNRDNPVTTDKLIELLWPEDDCENPLKALYSLMYRLRTLLKDGDEDAPEYILFFNNAYLWNKDATCFIDTVEFSSLFSQASNCQLSAPERIALYEQALVLYNGDYLSGSNHETWVLPWVNFYKRQFTQVVNNLCVLYNEKREYKKVVEFCQKAIDYDPYEESIHENLILALINLGQVPQAIAHYDYVSNMLYQELGVRPSQGLQELYKQLHTSSEDVQYDMASIKFNLGEVQTSQNGAFLCSLDVFRQIYQLETRVIERSGQSVFLGVTAVMTRDRKLPDSKTLTQTLSQLKQVALDSLRRGDVISQYSKSQLIMLLPGASYENCQKVIQRLEKRYYHTYMNEPILLISSLEPITPSDLQ